MNKPASEAFFSFYLLKRDAEGKMLSLDEMNFDRSENGVSADKKRRKMLTNFCVFFMLLKRNLSHRDLNTD